ncbi:MAG: zf-HC2 domain-containing protein [Myxococcota bacterium]
MNHLRARRRLAGLLDDTLPDSEAREVRSHLRRCRRCRRHRAELVLSAKLVEGLPHTVAPLAFDPAAHARLARLALWSEEPGPPLRERWTAPALSLAGVVVALTLAFSVDAWAPMLDHTDTFILAQVPQETLVMPVGWRPGR